MQVVEFSGKTMAKSLRINTIKQTDTQYIYESIVLDLHQSCMSKCPWARYWTPHCSSVRALRWTGDLSREYPALTLRQGWDWLQQQHLATPWKGISGYGQWHDMTPNRVCGKLALSGRKRVVNMRHGWCVRLKAQILSCNFHKTWQILVEYSRVPQSWLNTSLNSYTCINTVHIVKAYVQVTFFFVSNRICPSEVKHHYCNQDLINKPADDIKW